MTFVDVVDISSEDELVELGVKAVKLEADVIGSTMQQEEKTKAQVAKHQTSTTKSTRQEFEEDRSSNALSTGHSNSSILDQGQSPVDDTGLCSTSPICQAPICRQFWKAGNYDDDLGSKVTLQSIVLLLLHFVFEGDACCVLLILMKQYVFISVVDLSKLSNGWLRICNSNIKSVMTDLV